MNVLIIGCRSLTDEADLVEGLSDGLTAAATALASSTSTKEKLVATLLADGDAMERSQQRFVCTEGSLSNVEAGP